MKKIIKTVLPLLNINSFNEFVKKDIKEISSGEKESYLFEETLQDFFEETLQDFMENKEDNIHKILALHYIQNNTDALELELTNFSINIKRYLRY